MKYLHDTTAHLSKDNALLLAQYLIQGALEGDTVSLNVYLKYPIVQGAAPKMVLNTPLLSIETKAVWALVEGCEIYDGLEGVA